MTDVEEAHTDSTERRVLALVWTLVALMVAGWLAIAAILAFGGMALAPQLLSRESIATRARFSALTPEWRARIAKDYPGWKFEGFDTQNESGSSGDGTYYTATLVAPGQTHTIQIQYLSKNGGPAVSQDEVFRSDGSFHMGSSSLLSYLKRNYFDTGKTVDTVTVGEDAMAIVVWHDARAAQDPDAFKSDILSYESIDNVWTDEGL